MIITLLNNLTNYRKNRNENIMDTKTLEKLQQIYDQVDTFGKSLMEKEFPELKESDDSKMKELFENLVLSLCDTPSAREILQIYGKSKEDCLTWLEKQGKENTELPNGEDYGIDSLFHALQILQSTLGDVAGYQSDDGILEHKCAISAVKKLYTQTRWSKKDEAYSTLICSILNVEHPDGLYATGGITFFQNAYIKNQQIKDWLNSIKQRLTIQTEEESN